MEGKEEPNLEGVQHYLSTRTDNTLDRYGETLMGESRTDELKRLSKLLEACEDPKCRSDVKWRTLSVAIACAASLLEEIHIIMQEVIEEKESARKKSSIA